MPSLTIHSYVRPTHSQIYSYTDSLPLGPTHTQSLIFRLAQTRNRSYSYSHTHSGPLIPNHSDSYSLVSILSRAHTHSYRSAQYADSLMLRFTRAQTPHDCSDLLIFILAQTQAHSYQVARTQTRSPQVRSISAAHVRTRSYSDSLVLGLLSTETHSYPDRCTGRPIHDSSRISRIS